MNWTTSHGRRSRALVLAGLFALGCGGVTEYRPTERSERIGRDLRAAYYELTVDGRNVGDVRVWSPGGYDKRIDGEVEVIEIGLRIRNDSDAPIALRPARTSLDILTDDREFVTVRRPVVMPDPEELVVPPGDMRTITLSYPVPGDMEPDDVEGFEFNWVLRTDYGPYSQSTPFVQDEDRYAYYYYPYPYAAWWWYDPFFHPFYF